MKAGDDAFQRLRRTIEQLAEEEVRELVAEARIEARARVRAILVDALAQALLDRAEGEIAAPASAASDVGSNAPRPAASTSHSGHPPSGSATDPRGAEDEPVPGAGAEDGKLGFYVYGVIATGALDEIADMAGVDAAHKVSLVSEAGLTAVVSEVPLAQFGEDSLRESLNDVRWLEATARAHERVIDHVRARTTVVPMRLCTIYRSEESLRGLLTREQATLAGALRRLGGKTEWGVKVFLDRVELDRLIDQQSAPVAELRRQLQDAGEGEAYMLRRRMEELRGEESERLLEQRCQEMHARLSGLAAEARLNPLQQAEVTDHPGEMILNGVYLVDDLATADFHGAVDALAAQHAAEGLEVQLTGPWPAYNFVAATIETAW